MECYTFICIGDTHFAVSLTFPFSAPLATVIASLPTNPLSSLWSGLFIGISLGLALLISICLVLKTVTRKCRKKGVNSPPRPTRDPLGLRSKDSFRSVYLHRMYVLKDGSNNAEVPSRDASQRSTNIDEEDTGDGVVIISSSTSVEIG